MFLLDPEELGKHEFDWEEGAQEQHTGPPHQEGQQLKQDWDYIRLD